MAGAWSGGSGLSDQPRFRLEDLARHPPIVGGPARSIASACPDPPSSSAARRNLGSPTFLAVCTCCNP